jgi:hypothetical protein
MSLNDLVALPTGRLVMNKVLPGMRLLGVPVLADVGIGVLLLVKVAKCMVDLAVFAFVCTN